MYFNITTYCMKVQERHCDMQNVKKAKAFWNIFSPVLMNDSAKFALIRWPWRTLNVRTVTYFCNSPNNSHFANHTQFSVYPAWLNISCVIVVRLPDNGCSWRTNTVGIVNRPVFVNIGVGRILPCCVSRDITLFFPICRERELDSNECQSILRHECLNEKGFRSSISPLHSFDIWQCLEDLVSLHLGRQY